MTLPVTLVTDRTSDVVLLPIVLPPVMSTRFKGLVPE